MSKTVYLCLACDTDPDIPLGCREIGPGDSDQVWRGIQAGVGNFRRFLRRHPSLQEYAGLPITWLLRADRQLAELCGDASFCFRRFEAIWKSEYAYHGEIGWHPHLFRWDARRGRWAPYLAQDDDLEILARCLDSLRAAAEITSVRTGWDYHSNRLMRFFDEAGLTVDASAFPHCRKSGTWFYDWSRTPRLPYHPSRTDYRVPGDTAETSLDILEFPVLVRRLGLPLSVIRFLLRNLRPLFDRSHDISSWENARWRGHSLADSPRQFREAVLQTLDGHLRRNPVFLATFFHAQELLEEEAAAAIARNLEDLAFLAARLGYTLAPITLSNAAELAKQTGFVMSANRSNEMLPPGLAQRDV